MNFGIFTMAPTSIFFFGEIQHLVTQKKRGPNRASVPVFYMFSKNWNLWFRFFFFS